MADGVRLTNVSPRDLHLLITVDVGQKSEAETVTAWRVGEAVDAQWRLRGMEWFTNTNVLLIVGNGAPERRLCVDHWLRVGRCTSNNYQHYTYAPCGLGSNVE